MEYLKIDTLYLEVTHACNQNCKHCYLDGGLHHEISEMSTEQIKNIIEHFHKQGGSYVIITGGEPIMRKDCFEILDYIDSLELTFSFASNSLAMTEERLQRLASYKNIDMYFTSILGSDAIKHQFITKKDSFSKVLHAIEFFNKKQVNTYVQVTLADDYITDMEQIANLLIPYDYCFMKFTPIGGLGIKSLEADEKSDGFIVPESRFELFHNKLTDLQRQYPNRIEDSNISNFKQINDMIASYVESPLYSLSNGFVAVRPNGDISFSCNMGNPYTFGKAYDTINIPIDKKLNEYINLLKFVDEHILEESKEKIIELDVKVDEYINKLSKDNTR